MAPSSMERIAIILPDIAATKLQWTIECLHGIRKTYWITCINDPDMQHVALDRESFPSHLVVKPCDFNRLLANFQQSLQELTVIATESSPVSSLASRTSSDGKAVELRSYIDPVKENNDAALHTQLWIDPAEELQEYVHVGAAVDVTFSLKELKAFLSFCEGSEADMHVFFESAGKPILLAPRFGLDDSDHADFDATLVLATMLGSQLREADSCQFAVPQAACNAMPTSQLNRSFAGGAAGPQLSSQRVQQNSPSTAKSVDGQSDHTKVWSEISGSATKSWDNQDAARAAAHMQDSNDASEEILVGLQRQQLQQSNVDRDTNSEDGAQFRFPGLMRVPPKDLSKESDTHQLIGGRVPSMQGDGNLVSKRNPGNWLSADFEEDEDDDDDEDGDEFCVQSTPPQRRGMA